MNRPRSTNKNLEKYPGLKARQLKSKTRYYYRFHNGKQEALGDDLPKAIERWQAITNQAAPPSTIERALEAYTLSERFGELSTKTRYEYGRAIVRLTKVFGPAAFADFRPATFADYLKQAHTSSRQTGGRG